jgi:glyceraldehyde-3-phosphate dehydrogenase (NAD(P))
MLGSKNVLVIGTGTIGEPLVGLLCHFKDQLGLDEIMVHKRTPLMIDRSKVVNLQRRGARLITDQERVADFEKIGVSINMTTDEALEACRVIIDCTPSGNEMKEKWYRKYEDSTDLFLAQGSEFGFGKPYARGINDGALDRDTDKYVQVVSCNTHNLSVLISALALGDEGPENLVEGRFVCIRRANDISQDAKFCPSPEVGSHGDSKFGTHHARDAWHLFNTMGYDLNLFSSAMKLNTQFMHIIQFHLKLRKATTQDRLLERIRKNDRIAMTHKKSANSIFSFGRDHGFYGRILNQTVIPYTGLHVSGDGKDITGFCFTPQDGNSLLSSVAATVWAYYPETYEKIVQCLKPFFFAEV